MLDMKRILLLIVTLLSMIGFFVSAVMFVMAIRFGELGRVVFYGVLAVASAELAILSILRLRRKPQ